MFEKGHSSECAVVTGANGFIGNAFVRYLEKKNVSVIAFVHNGHKDRIPLSDMVEVSPWELDDLSQSSTHNIRTWNADIFYHLAWQGTAGKNRSDACIQIQNVQRTLNALRLAKRMHCKRFVCAGSIMEYETILACYEKGMIPKDSDTYGVAKAAAHLMCMPKAMELGIEAVWVTITNAYGIGETSPRMLNTTLRKCLHGISPEFTSGIQNYDFVYIDDVVRALELIGERGKPFHAYMIGSSTARPLREFLSEVQATVAPTLPFRFGDIPFNGVNLPLATFDCTATEQDTGFRADISFAEGIRKTYDWIATTEGAV